MLHIECSQQRSACKLKPLTKTSYNKCKTNYGTVSSTPSQCDVKNILNKVLFVAALKQTHKQIGLK